MNEIISCATCISQDEQNSVLASNGAVFVMLGAMAIVFGGMLAVILSFVRRARRVAAENQLN
jgi:hypothetical protein